MALTNSPGNSPERVATRFAAEVLGARLCRIPLCVRRALPSPFPSRRVVAALMLVVPVVTLDAVALTATPAFAEGDTYKLHMENGVKLFSDKNYSAALAEFQAAYDAKPSPNPLLNIALCEKARFRYPRAIAALESALAKHASAMELVGQGRRDRRHQRDACAAGCGLLVVSPSNATVLVDGEELEGGAANRPIALGPGEHKSRLARRDTPRPSAP